MNRLNEDKLAGAQQKIEAAKGATIQDVIQAVVSGQVTGDVHIGDKVYTRSSLEELNDYLARAVAIYKSNMYQTLRPPAPPEHPYKSLYAFDLEDARLFFGREAATQDLYERVLNNRLTILHARSGAGKTSLLNAGLSPRLIQEGYLPVYARTRPYEEDPTLAAKRTVAPRSLGPWPELLPGLSLHEFLGLVCTHLSRETQGLVVIFDPFEDFLVSLPEPDLRLPFIKALNDCHEDRSLPVRFVIALRRENLWDLDEFQKFIPHILHNRYGLPLMSQAEVVQAITSPLSQLPREVSIDPALLDALLEDLGRDDVELTHLQIVCAKLYDSLSKEKKVITLDLYRSLGGTEKILTTYLNDTLSILPNHKRSMARNILKELVSSEATNWILSLVDLGKQVPLDPNLLEDVLERLVDARLLRREDAFDVKEYELAHGYLAEEIIHWIDQDNLEHKRVQELLQRELASWRVHKTLVDEDRLDVLRNHIKHLALDDEAQSLLFHSALERGHDVGLWLAQIEDKESAVEQIAVCLVHKRHLTKKIASDLKSNLNQLLRRPLCSALWTIFDSVRGADRRNAARALWALKSWLSMTELLRIIIVLGPVWVVQVLPFVLLLPAIVSVWPFLSRERAVPGRWKRIEEGKFVIGVDKQEAEDARFMCLEGVLESQRENCPTLEGLLKWSGTRLNARLPTFHIMENEVTNAQYKRCVGEGPCKKPRQESGAWIYDRSEVNKPVTQVSWFDAMTYCAWLEGRLPTEEEWEKAARGPEGNYFPWSNEWDPSKVNLEHGRSGSAQSIGNYTEDVSPYGVKNLAGNVQEWTASEYVDFSSVAFENDVLLCKLEGDTLNCNVDDSVNVVLRGGAWGSARSAGMGSNRLSSWPSAERKEIGFRCVCPSDELICGSPWEPWWVWFGKY